MAAKVVARKARGRSGARKARRSPKPSGTPAKPVKGRRARASSRTARGKTARRKGTSAARRGPEAVAEHFARSPPGRREPMLRLWAMVQEALPGCTCLVSYGIAIAAVGGQWVAGVGGGKAHASLYLLSPDFVRAHAGELAGQDVSGGTVRFPLGRPIPGPLVRRLVRARLVSLGSQYGAGTAPPRPAAVLTSRPPPSPKPTPLDRFPKPMLVPLDKPVKP